jgi:hypothetical protein
MKLSDLFLPKHAHSDPEVRKKAVLNLKDQNLLAQISEKDKDSGVRSLALQRLNELRGDEAPAGAEEAG